MNKIFRSLWNSTPATWVAAPETSRGPARCATSGGRDGGGHSLRAVAAAALLACAVPTPVPVLAAGGAGGQPVGDTSLNAGSGGSDGAGGGGALNDTTLNASGGGGGSSTPAGVTAGANANVGTFGGATAGTGGAAGAASTPAGPGAFQGDAGGAGQSQTGGPGAGDGYGGGGGGGFQGASIANNAATSTGTTTGGSGGGGGDGYWAAGGGGAGGYGAILNGPLGNHAASGTAAGGAGGQGGNAFSQGGGGGSGGGGFFLNATNPGLVFSSTGTLAGGAGGAGGSELPGARANASGGGGGAGGIGATLAGGAVTFNNSGAITGGAGGAGGAAGGGAGGTGSPGGGGDGGAGLASTGGAGAIIANTGTIAGGAGGAGGANSNGGASGANGAGGAGVTGANLAIANGGSIAGGLGGDGATRAAAVAFTGGANTLTLNAGSSMTGAVAIGAGATARIVAGAGGLVVGNALLLGGTGTVDTNGNDLAWTGAISGAADLVKTGAGVLALGGAATHTGATNVAAGTLRTGAANVLSAASPFTVAAGATLDLAGQSQAIASMANGGTVSLVGAAPGTVLTVAGPWVGNGGTLRLGTALGGSASASDRLVLSGPGAAASGTTNVQITNLGGLGALTTGNGIEVISAVNGATTTAQTTKNAFALAGTHVDAGAYEYRLYAADASGAGENWYLRSTAAPVPPAGGGTGTGTGTSTGNGGGGGIPVLPVPTYRAEVPLYAALPEQVRQSGLAMLANMHQRTGDDFAMAASTAAPAQGQRQGWGRVISTDRTIAQRGTASPTSKGRLTGFQAGTDLWADPNFRAGVYVGQLDGDMRVNGFASGLPNRAVGTNDLKSEYVGAYATWKSDGGLYVDGVLQAGRHRYTASPVLGLGSGGKGRSTLASIEVGQSFAIAQDWAIEPQVQLVHQRTDLRDTAIPGALVRQDSHNGTLVRAGMRVKGRVATSVGPLQPYVRANVYRGSRGTDVARFVGPAGFADIATRTGGTSTELAAGATLQVGENTSLYAELGKQWSSGGDSRVRSGVNASVGVKLRW